MLKPRAIEPGDRIALVSPASPFARDEFDHGVGELRALGFEPVYEESVFARQGYVSGPPNVRARALNDAWADASIRGLVAARGGYGSAQLLPLLDRDKLRASPKVFVGYSDITTLLAFLTTHCGIVAFHGPMIDQKISRGADGYDRTSFLNAVCRTEPMGELTPAGLDTIRPGEARGLLLGGTLTQLLASLGTPYAFDPPPGFILFIDEVGERPYRLDRMMTQLQQTGLLRRASVVVVGELPRCDEPSSGLTGRGVIADLLRDFPGPVLVGFPSGHTTGPVMTLPLGVTARAVGGVTPRVVIEESAVQ